MFVLTSVMKGFFYLIRKFLFRNLVIIQWGSKVSTFYYLHSTCKLKHDLRFVIENSVSVLKLYDIFVLSMNLEHMYVFNDYVLKSHSSKENKSFLFIIPKHHSSSQLFTPEVLNHLT